MLLFVVACCSFGCRSLFACLGCRCVLFVVCYVLSDVVCCLLFVVVFVVVFAFAKVCCCLLAFFGVFGFLLWFVVCW